MISPEVAEARLVTGSGESLPVKIVSLPPSMGYDDRVVWAVAPGADDRAMIVGFDREGFPIGDPILPAGPRITIATEEDPVGGPWELYLEPTSDGIGLWFGFTNQGGGGGCCLRPLRKDFQLDGWGSGSGQPSNITALASDLVARVVFEVVDGSTIEGALYPVPDDSIGIPQVGLVIVPEDVPLEGELVAYDSDGNEIGREFVGETPEPAGPTPRSMRSGTSFAGLATRSPDGPGRTPIPSKDSRSRRRVRRCPISRGTRPGPGSRCRTG